MTSKEELEHVRKKVPTALDLRTVAESSNVAFETLIERCLKQSEVPIFRVMKDKEYAYLVREGDVNILSTLIGIRLKGRDAVKSEKD